MNTMLLQLVMLVKSYVPSVEREEGQGMVEYALIIALVAIALVGALGVLSGAGGIGGVLSGITDELTLP